MTRPSSAPDRLIVGGGSVAVAPLALRGSTAERQDAGSDLILAEAISVPAALLVLLLAMRTVVAALLPLVFAGSGLLLGSYIALVTALLVVSLTVNGCAVGMRKSQVMRTILMPQAVRIMLPAIIRQSVVALKDSALGLTIAYEELARAGRQIYVFYNNPLAVGLLIGAIYVIVNASLSRLAVFVERRTAS